MTNPKCPDCKTSEHVDYTGEDKPSESGELYDVKVYKCFSCGAEFDEEEAEAANTAGSILDAIERAGGDKHD